MTDEKSTTSKKSDSRPTGTSSGLQESRSLIGSRIESTSSTNVETPATSRPKKK